MYSIFFVEMDAASPLEQLHLALIDDLILECRLRV